MKALAAAGLVLFFSPASPAQEQKAARPRPRAPVSTGLTQEMLQRMFAPIDKTIRELEVSVRRIQDCADGSAYLAKDFAATKRRLQPKSGASIPSNQAPLLLIKQSRMSSHQIACVATMKSLGQDFDAAIAALALAEPRGHPGIAARKQKVSAMRQRYNRLTSALGGKAASETDNDNDGPTP